MNTPLENTLPTGIRKAAIPVASLDMAEADSVLEALEPDQAARIRQAMVDLGRIDPHEQRRVIEEFHRVETMVPEKQPAGIELDDRLAEKLLPWPIPSLAEKSPGGQPADSPAGNTPVFGFLQKAEDEKLAGVLSGERPQMIALVLSHLPPELAGRVLARFSPSQQVDVVHRLIALEETDPQILHEVEEALRSRLSQHVGVQQRPAVGMKALAGILEASSGQLSLQILDNLAAFDRPLAERLSPQPLAFNQLVRLDDTTLEIIFRSLEPDLIAAALLDAPPELGERVRSCLPCRDAESLRQRLADPGPILLSDMEDAQQRVIDHARRLAIEGAADLPRGDPTQP